MKAGVHNFLRHALSFVVTVTLISVAVAQESSSLTVELAGNWALGDAKCAEEALSRELQRQVEVRPISPLAVTDPGADFVIPTDGIDAIKYADGRVVYQKILDAGTYNTKIASRSGSLSEIYDIKSVEIDISSKKT